MRAFRFALMFVIALSVIAIPYSAVYAQDGGEEDTPISTGCEALNGTEANVDPSPYETTADAYNAGEVIILRVTGSGTEFTLTDAGSAVATPVLIEETLIYTIPSDGTYTFGVAVEGTTDATTTASFTCATPTGYLEIELDPDGDGKVTLCHYPPGNPGAAHTITVGLPAASAHLGHGDELGECPPGVDSRQDNYEDGIVTFINEEAGILEIYGNCVEDDCELVLLVELDILVVEEGFTYEFVSEFEDAPYVIVYFLGESHLQDDIYVFQINIYQSDDLLMDDTLLLLTNEDGYILGWANRLVLLEATELELNPDIDDDGSYDNDDDD